MSLSVPTLIALKIHKAISPCSSSIFCIGCVGSVISWHRLDMRTGSLNEEWVLAWSIFII